MRYIFYFNFPISGGNIGDKCSRKVNNEENFQNTGIIKRERANTAKKNRYQI